VNCPFRPVVPRPFGARGSESRFGDGDVPAASSLGELHELFQVALGWTDSHLHRFEGDGKVYGIPDAGDDRRGQDAAEAGLRLRDLPARFSYLYDFGDGWEHDVEFSDPATRPPVAWRVRAAARRRTVVARTATRSCGRCSRTRTTRTTPS
jgi:hypothetical protein